MKRKTKMQLARETAQHISMVRKSRRKASLQSETALLKATNTLRFCGRLIIQPREMAISKVMEISRQEEPAYFTDGPVYIPTNEGQRHPIEKRRTEVKLAAAIADQAPKSSQEWVITSFSVRLGGRHHYLQAELAGIAGALAIAISNIANRRSEAPPSKVIILTDCQAAMCQLQKLRANTREKVQPRTLPCKLITRSQYLHSLDVLLEIRWIPAHNKKIRGNIYADTEARRTARGNLNVYEEEIITVSLSPGT